MYSSKLVGSREAVHTGERAEEETQAAEQREATDQWELRTVQWAWLLHARSASGLLRRTRLTSAFVLQ